MTGWHQLSSHWSVRSRGPQTLLWLAEIFSELSAQFVISLKWWQTGLTNLSYIGLLTPTLGQTSVQLLRSLWEVPDLYPVQLMDLHDPLEEVGGWGGGGRRVIFSNFLAGTRGRGRPWEILLTLLKIGTIQRLAGLKCLGGQRADDDKNLRLTQPFTFPHNSC